MEQQEQPDLPPPIIDGPPWEKKHELGFFLAFVETIKALKTHQAAIWEKHGIFAIGDNPYDTFDLIDILGKSAKIYFLTRSSGHEPQGLSDEQLQVLKELSSNF